MEIRRMARRFAPVLVSALLAAALAVPATVFAVAKFTDVRPSSPYAKDVNAVVAAGVMQACGKRKFCPKAGVTRVQLARSLDRLGALAPGATPVAHAATALTAANATHAASAASATHATSATSATSATNAAHATAADDAAKLGGVASSGYLTPSGQVLVQAATGSWRPFNSTDPFTTTYFSSQAQWMRTSIGSSFLSVSPDFPSVLFGKALRFEGVEFCYDTFTNSLSYVEINRMNHTTGSLGRNLLFSDPTSRTGNECRRYTLPTPLVLGATDEVNFFIQANWATANSAFAIGRTTFIFTATTTAVAAAPLAGQTTGRPVSGAQQSATDVP